MTKWSYQKGKIRASEGLHWAVYDIDGNLVSKGTHTFCTPTEEELARWGQEVKIIARRIENNAWKGAEQFYIRFNELPKGGRSRNFATGEYEDGVSCYEAEYDPINDVFRFVENGSLAGAAITYVLNGAKVYLIRGKHVGMGADGEPVLQDVEIVAELKYDRDRDGYVIKE